MRDIAAAAEVSTRAVFASFADKHELFDAVIAASNEQAAAMVEAAGVGQVGPTIQRMLERFGVLYVFYLERLPLVQACLAQTWSRCDTARAFERYARGPARRTLEEMLQNGIDRGELLEDLDLRLTSDFIWDAYLANYRGAVLEQWTLDEIIKRMEAQLQRILCGYLRG